MLFSMDGVIFFFVGLIGFALLQRFVVSECDFDCRKECLDLHNKYRENHQVLPLYLDDELSKQAQEWADNNNTVGSSNWTRKGIGECWAWGSLYATWKDVIKEWHDQEIHIDWNTKKSKDGNAVYCFSQIVWKRTTKIGCGKGQIASAPFYVVQADKPAKIIEGLIGYESDNINKPLVEDLHWYDNETMTGASPNAKAPEFEYGKVPDEKSNASDFTWQKIEEKPKN